MLADISQLHLVKTGSRRSWLLFIIPDCFKLGRGGARREASSSPPVFGRGSRTPRSRPTQGRGLRGRGPTWSGGPAGDRWTQKSITVKYTLKSNLLEICMPSFDIAYIGLYSCYNFKKNKIVAKHFK